MELSFFKDKKITVFGLGLHGGGVATVKFLSEHGARVIATDLKTKQDLAVSLEKLKGLKNVEYVLGQHRREDFTNVDMVIKNPAILWTDKHIKLALENKIPVEMDSSIFFALCKNPIIGITGTKGKTTTATLINEIFIAAGKHSIKVGIGQEPVLDKLSQIKKDTVVVFELSSWRLSALGRAKKSPHVAVTTNIMRDHLNYYKTMEKYIEDKSYIFSNQTSKDWFVYDCDDENLLKLAEKAKSQKISFCSKSQDSRCAIYIEEGAVYLDDGVDAKKVVDLLDIKLVGKHNQKNVMAAIGACHAVGIDILAMRKALKQFSGIPHRLEFVSELDGVGYYNDTAATIPDAAMLSIDSFSNPIVLIAGGNDKELEFSSFAKKITSSCKKAVLLSGTATDKIISELDKIDKEWRAKNVEVANSMQEAVEKARAAAQTGDVILLSPGAASFGLFLNEFDRGDQFREIVKKLR